MGEARDKEASRREQSRTQERTLRCVEEERTVVAENCGSDGVGHLLSVGHGLGVLCTLYTGWCDNTEKASAGVLASSDLSAFLKPFARDRLAQLPPAPTTEETLRNQFLAHVRTTRRAMATAFGAILASCPELNGLKPVTAEALTIQVTNRTHLCMRAHHLGGIL